MMRLLLASTALWRGRCRDALEAASEALAILRETHSEFGIVQSLATLSRAYAAVGMLTDSKAAIEEAIAVAAAAAGQPQLDFAHQVAGAAATQAGETARAMQFLDLIREDPDGPLMLGSTDRTVTRALALLQSGRDADAEAELASMSLDREPGPYFLSTSALLAVTQGRVDAGIEMADRVATLPSSTYVDLRAALIAKGLGYARKGALLESEAAFDDALEVVDSTDSRLSQSVVRLAKAVAYEHLHHRDAIAARNDADRAAESIGASLSGWALVFRFAVSYSARSSSSWGY